MPFVDCDCQGLTKRPVASRLVNGRPPSSNHSGLEYSVKVKNRVRNRVFQPRYRPSIFSRYVSRIRSDILTVSASVAVAVAELLLLEDPYLVVVVPECSRCEAADRRLFALCFCRMRRRRSLRSIDLYATDVCRILSNRAFPRLSDHFFRKSNWTRMVRCRGCSDHRMRRSLNSCHDTGRYQYMRRC